MGKHDLSCALSDAICDRLNDFCLIADLAGADLLVSDAESGQFLAFNASAPLHLGYSSEELLQLSPDAIQADPDHNAAWLAARRSELRASGAASFLTRHRCKNDTILDVEVSVELLSLEDRSLLVSLVRDCTASRQWEARLLDSLTLLQDGEVLSGVGVWELRFADGRLRWSEQTRRICKSEGVGEESTFWAYGALVHPDDRNGWRQEFQRAVNRGDPFRNRHRLAFIDGSEVLVQAEALFSYDNSGQPVRAIGTLKDVSEETSFLQELSLERSSDPLTGLPNKLASVEDLDRRLNGRSYNASLAVFSLDVDGFQEINDNFGSDLGDQVLQVMARRLRELIGEHGWLARLSSDQFLIVLEENISSLGDAMSVGRQLQQRWTQQDQLLAELPVFPTFSIGLATYPEHAQDGKSLIQCANTALMKAKSLGRIQMCAYSSTISRQIQERMDLGSELAQAIKRNQLRLMVQPQLHRSSSLVGGEMLLRWTNRMGIAVPPSHFIPLAEESGLILQLSAWTLQTTVEHLGRWQKAGLQAPRLALNVSPRELEMPGRRFISALLDGLREHNLSPDQLELEITETALLRNPLLAREQLRVLADQGFRIAIDDFGTGYSSLELLRSLPVHRLKIDRTFVQSITVSPQDQTIVKATITLAHGLGMECIAEGVETSEQRQVLEDLGCDVYQGYLCGRPVELEAFEQMLRTHEQTLATSPDQQPTLPSYSVVQLKPLGEGSSVPSTFEQLDLLRAAFDITDDYFLLLQVLYRHDGLVDDLLILEANRAACRYMRQEREAVVGQTLLTIFPQMQQNGLMDLCIDAAIRNTPTTISDFAYQKHEIYRDNRCYDIQILPIKGFLMLSWRDVTERSRAARSLADAAALYRLLTENIVEVVVLLNRSEEVVWVSPSLQPMTGWHQEQWRGKAFRELFAAADGRPEPVELGTWLSDSGPIRQGRLRLADPKGGWSWVQLSVRRLSPAGSRTLDALDGAPSPQGELALEDGYVLTLQPVDDQVLEERRLLQLVNTDPLTNLESRSAILGWLEHRLLDDRIHTAQPLALLFCDFDDFKSINDTYGHACGDMVLQTVAERILSVLRHRDHAGRLGGDEFLLLLDGVQSLDAAIGVAEKLQRLIDEPIPWGEQRIPASVSIGVALHGAGEDAALFLKRADRNMYAAKLGGRRRVVAL